MREHPPCPTAYNMSPQPHIYAHSQIVKLDSFSESCRALVCGGKDAATQLDAPGGLSRASNLPSTIIPTFPILNSFLQISDLEVIYVCTYLVLETFSSSILKACSSYFCPLAAPLTPCPHISALPIETTQQGQSSQTFPPGHCSMI